MPKLATPSPERAQLVAAHQELAAAQHAHAEAEVDYEQARSAYGCARADVGDLDERIAALRSGRWRAGGIPQLIGEVDDKVEEARAAREVATQAAYPLGVAEEQAQARVKEAENAVYWAKDRLAKAAMAVTRAEFEPIAREHLARCMEAFDILLTSGPHLVALVDRELLSPDLVREVENVAGSLLRRATAWPDFEARYRHSPWLRAPELLAMDPTASLPQAAP